jgi:hypothetical protein
LAVLAGRSAAVVAKSIDDITPVTDEKSAIVWKILPHLAPKLYPRGPSDRAVWEGAGGDLSTLDLSDTGRTQWFRAVRILQLGGGGQISLSSLLLRMLEDYGGSYELRYLCSTINLTASP